MGLFFRKQLATVEPHGAAELLVRQADGTIFTVSVEELPWVIFVLIGEAFYANEEGWYVLPFSGPKGTTAIALKEGCPGLYQAIRVVLCPAVDRAARLLRIDLAEPPRFLRGAAARKGVALLNDSAATQLLNEQFVTVLRTVRDFPLLP